MKGCSVLLGGLLAITTSVAFAADPDFKDYTVTPVFTGINHEPVPQEHSNPMMDMDRAQALKRKVNFAGHYILYRVGCGGSVICGEVLDARTGEVVGGLPNAYDGNTSACRTSPIVVCSLFPALRPIPKRMRRVMSWKAATEPATSSL